MLPKISLGNQKCSEIITSNKNNFNYNIVEEMKNETVDYAFDVFSIFKFNCKIKIVILLL